MNEDKTPGPKVASVQIRVAHLNGCASGRWRVAIALRVKLWPLEVKESRQPKSGPVWLHQCYLEERKGGNVIDKNDINSQRERWLLNKSTSLNLFFSGGELFCFEKAWMEILQWHHLEVVCPVFMQINYFLKSTLKVI